MLFFWFQEQFLFFKINIHFLSFFFPSTLISIILIIIADKKGYSDFFYNNFFKKKNYSTITFKFVTFSLTLVNARDFPPINPSYKTCLFG